VKVGIHRLDAVMLADAAANLSSFVEKPYTAEPADVLLEDGQTVEEAGIRLEVLHTPGHTPGGIALLMKSPSNNIVFTGDSLFCQGVGRTDLDGGDEALLIRSIKEKLLTLPDSTVIYPGHGPSSTIGEEKKGNLFSI